MRKFEGNINGTVYTDEIAFNKAIADWDGTSDMSVSYHYTYISDEKDESKQIDSNHKNDCDNIVSENQYVKSINNKKDVELDDELIGKLKNASNKSEIKRNVCKKIDDFDNIIKDNILYVNELKTEYKKLDEKMELINKQIKTLDDVNNNYYLQKEYYTNIKNLIDDNKVKEDSGCECVCCDSKKIFNKIYEMTPQELAKYINKNKIYNLDYLVDHFLKIK